MTKMNMFEMASAMKQAGFSAQEVAEALAVIAEAQEVVKGNKGNKGRKSAPKPEKEMVDFVKKDGTVKRVSKAQAEAWEKARDAADERKATYADRRAAFTAAECPKELADAIRKNRAAVTAKVARSLGFVGTKNDLKELKLAILGVAK